MHPSIEQQVTFLYTSDLEKTARFYEQKIGLDLALDQGDCRIYRTSPSGFLGFCKNLKVETSLEGVIFTIVTEHVDSWYRYLSARGVTFEKVPEVNRKFNIYHCFFRDPNGYMIEIQHFLDHRWKP